MQVKIDAQKKNNAKWMSLGGLHFSLQPSIPTVCVAAWSEVTLLIRVLVSACAAGTKLQ